MSRNRSTLSYFVKIIMFIYYRQMETSVTDYFNKHLQCSGFSRYGNSRNVANGLINTVLH